MIALLARSSWSRWPPSASGHPLGRSQGSAIAGDELTTSVVTGQLAQDIDAAYAAPAKPPCGPLIPPIRSRLLGTLYTSLVPAVDAQLLSLERLHAADPPAEHADIALFVRQWTAVRDLLSPAAPDRPGRPRRSRAG